LQDHSYFVLTIAGIALFMHGMQLASENLQKLTANRTRDLMAQLSKKKFLGVILGIVLTVMIQSSGAVTSMLVGLGSARVITLRQVMTVLLGTAVGTTFTVQLISFKLTHFGLPIFAGSFFIFFLSKNRMVQKLMGVVMGFGLIFFGIEIIGQGTESLKNIENFVGFLDTLSRNPLYAVAVTALFTAVVHSSAVTIGFAMSLAAAQLISLEDSIYWVFGANIGTTGTALLASLGGNYIGRQVAWAHCFHKVLSVMLFIPMVPWLVDVFGPMSVERGIANFHTFYNLMAAVVFYPGVGWGAHLIEKMFPPSKSEQEYGPRYLVRSEWLSTTMAVAHAERESLRMADIVGKMLQDSITLFKNEDPVLAKKIKSRDDKVDLLTRAIRLYLTKDLNWSNNRSEQDQKDVMRILNFTADLENAADVIDNNLRDMAAKKHNLKLEFSPEGWAELEEFHSKVMEVFSYSINCFVKRDEHLASKVVYCKREIRKIEHQFRETHLTRLIKGEQSSINTSSIHMDVLSEYRRISGLLSNHVYEQFYRADKYNLMPRQSETTKPTE
jgi:phosphate:Na+ symporter